MTSQEFIVGDPPCTFEAVRDTLKASTTAARLLSSTKLEALARRLEFPDSEYANLMKPSSVGIALLYDILYNWRSQKSKLATLQNLIIALEKEDLNNCADELRTKFLPENSCLSF